MAASSRAEVKTFYETATGTCQHVVWCGRTKEAAIVDSVLDFDLASASTSTTTADTVLDFVKEQGLDVKFVLETHAHADHVSAAPYLKRKLGGTAKIGIGAKITDVQGVFKGVYGLDDEECPPDGSQFDSLFKEGDEVKLGDVTLTVMSTPGHTPACISYVAAGDCVFTGDTLFMPDSGTARCDFPLGSATTLWESIQKLLALPPETRVFTCHDYGKGGSREPQWETTIADERKANIHVKEGTSSSEFIQWRSERDATLGAPKLIIPSVQANINAGRFPSEDKYGHIVLKTPVNVLKKPDGDSGVETMPGPKM